MEKVALDRPKLNPEWINSLSKEEKAIDERMRNCFYEFISTTGRDPKAFYVGRKESKDIASLMHSSGLIYTALAWPTRARYMDCPVFIVDSDSHLACA